MTYIIGTYESAIEDGAAGYEDEFDSLEQLSEVIKRAENYGMTLTDLNVMKYEPDSGGSDYDDLGSLQELTDLGKSLKGREEKKDEKTSHMEKQINKNRTPAPQGRCI